MEMPRTALVREIDDPDGMGRVQLMLPSTGDLCFTPWAHVLQAYLTSDPDTVPEIGDEVLVIFDNGDRSRPIVIGRLRTGQDPELRFGRISDEAGATTADVLRLRSTKARLRPVDKTEE
jgi:phage baseplate assembly protein gpV